MEPDTAPVEIAAPVVAAEAAATAAASPTNLLADAPGAAAPAAAVAEPTAEEKATADKAAAEAAKAAAALPEDYKITAPEGTVLDQPLADATVAAFREAGITKDQADKLAPYLATKAAEMRGEAMNAWNSLQNSWQAEVKADPEIGGAKLTASLADAAKALDAYGGADLRKALATTGAGNNPAVIRAFVKIGRAMGEENRIPAGRTSAGPSNSLEAVSARMYGGNK